MVYYINYNGQTIGPMNLSQLGAYSPTPDTLISCNGGEWRPMYTYPDLMAAYGPAAAHSQQSAPGADATTKTICGICALLIGGLGLQYFLVGKVGGGIINILLAICTCGLWSIINLVQGILILTMSQQEWERKFVYSTSTFPVF